ncbi:MAG: flgK [Sphingomonadales bacterium]|nr:flgK [Sphingomonadales bacterium]
MSSDLLSIGASGLRAYKTALGAVGDNIANAQTIGYARRSARMTEVASGSTSIAYRNTDRSDGVEVRAIDRATDQFRIGEARLATSADAKAGAISDWMTVTETALSDGDNGVGAALAQVFAAGDALAADPVARQPRAAFLASMDEAAQAIRTSAGDLQRAASGVGDAGQSSMDRLNSDLATLASVNLAIKTAGPGTATFVELSDQRDGLVDRISARLNVDIVTASEGTTTLSSNGQPLLNGIAHATLSMTIAGDGRLAFVANGTPLQPTSGALAGLASAANIISDRRSALDGMAQDFATAVNGWQAAGQTAAGAPGTALLSATGGAITLSVLQSDPDTLALAAPGGAASGNALALATVRHDSGVEAQWDDLVNAQAQSTASANTQRAVTSARETTANAARDGVEGVDLDHEAADLLRFQQAYEGSARIIQTAKELLDTILGLFR